MKKIHVNGKTSSERSFKYNFSSEQSIDERQNNWNTITNILRHRSDAMHGNDGFIYTFPVIFKLPVLVLDYENLDQSRIV